MTDLIQARGALIAYRTGGRVTGASGNAARLFGSDPMGRDPADVLGRDGLHAVRNTASLPIASERSIFSGRTGDLDLYTHVTDGFLVVEAEQAAPDPLPDAYAIERDVALMAGTEDPDTLAGLLRTLSGFDAVMVLGPDGTRAESGHAPEGIPPANISGKGLYVLDDAARMPEPVVGEVPSLDRANLRLPGEDDLDKLGAAGIAAMTVLRARRQTLILMHARPRMPGHRTRLVLLHLAQLL